MIRTCKYCENEFETNKKNGKVCSKCKNKNREKRLMKHLNLL